MSGRRMIVTGRVQGVGYREWTVDQARALGLSGWVRNRRDGSVEILAAGDAAALAELELRCRRGPPAANVTLVVTAPADAERPAGFVRRPTA